MHLSSILRFSQQEQVVVVLWPGQNDTHKGRTFLDSKLHLNPLAWTELILNRFEELNTPFQDCLGQLYGNGENMQVRKKGVQARLLAKNPRAFNLPCSAHTLSLMVLDAAKAFIDNIFCLFVFLCRKGKETKKKGGPSKLNSLSSSSSAVKHTGKGKLKASNLYVIRQGK